MSNPVDRARLERQRKAAHAEAVEQHSPQLVGALHGLAAEIGDQRLVTERLIAVFERLELTCRGLTDELAALRSQRARGGNGHAPDDTLEEGV